MSSKNPKYQPMLSHYYPGPLLVPTSEDWHPSFDMFRNCLPEGETDGFVEVSIHPNWTGPDTFKINVRGADDTCMMLVVDSKEELESAIRRLPSIITMAALSAQGYKFD
jgi:hypothetical protein